MKILDAQKELKNVWVLTLKSMQVKVEQYKYV